MNRIVSADILRIVALVLVVVQHAFQVLPGKGDWFHFQGCARFGVSIFIILSGYFSYVALSRTMSTRDFYWRRAATIYPSYWCAYLVMGVIMFLVEGRIAMRGQILPMLLTVVGMDGYLMTQVKTYYLVGEWFVGFILLTYLLAPFLFKCVRRQTLLTLLVVFVISCLSFAFTPKLQGVVPLWNRAAHFNVTSRLFEYACGMAIAGNLEILRRCRWWIVGAGIALLSAAGLVPGYAFTSLSMVGVVSWTVAFSVLFFLCDLVRFDGKGLFAQILSKMATLSFLVFLFHHQLLYLVQRHGKLVGNGDCLVWLVLADFVVAYFLAHLCSSPVGVVKALVFDPLKPKRGSGDASGSGNEEKESPHEDGRV